MKRVISQLEFKDIQATASKGINSDISAGGEGHIDDHIAISNLLNYLPAVQRSTFEKVGEDEWVMDMDGSSQESVSNAVIDQHLEQYITYSDMLYGAFAVVAADEVVYPVGSSMPVGTKILDYTGGPSAYNNYVKVESFDGLQDVAYSVKNAVDRTDGRVKEFFNVYTYRPKADGGWAEDAYLPRPEYPLTGIKYAYTINSKDQINGEMSFADSTINGPEDLSSINTVDYSAIQIWTWKLGPEDAVSRIAELETQVQDLTADKETLEGKVSTLESDNSTLNATVSTLESDNVSLNATVSGLETDFGTLSSANDTLNSTVSTLEGNVATLTSEKEALEGQVSSLESTIGDLTSRLEALETPTSPE